MDGKQLFTVYGIRAIGTTEVRYVGFTGISVEQRLYCHGTKTPGQGGVSGPLREWLLANNAEAFAIRKARTRLEARAMEKGAIAALAHAGHRLFNSDHMPRNLEIAA